MAVDARHLNLLFPQLISTGELYYPNQGNVMSAYNDGQMGGCLGVTSTPDCVLPSHHQSLVCESLQPKTSMNTDSGLSCNAVPAPRKRSRDCCDNTSLISNTNYACPQKNAAFSQYPPIGVTFVSQLQQCQLEIDALVSQHTKKMRMEIEERQKQHARLIVQALGEGLMKKLQEKDEQIQKMGKLNMILQERVKSLYVETQLWRDLAQTNEATANNLRTNLEQVLAHVSDERFSSGGGMGVVEEDVQSCCGSSSSSDDRGIEEEEVEGRRRLAAAAGEAQDERCMVATEAHGKVKCGRMCRVCGERESCVLLLPCRHLCLCTLCGSSLLQTCPVCNSNMNATVHVNTSSSS